MNKTIMSIIAIIVIIGAIIIGVQICKPNKEQEDIITKVSDEKIADGFIARKFNLISNFGKLMDPLADKLTQISTLTSLVIIGIIPLWILIIVLLKEFIMIVGASFLYGKDVVVYSKWYGKLATVLFYVAIVFSLLAKQFNLIGFWSKFDFLLYCLALIATVFSLIMYVKDLYQKGFIDKQDLKKEVTIDKKEKKKSSSK